MTEVAQQKLAEWSALKRKARAQGIAVHKMSKAQVLAAMAERGLEVGLVELESEPPETPGDAAPVASDPPDDPEPSPAVLEFEPELPGPMVFRAKLSTRDCIDIVDQKQNVHAKVFRQGRPFRGTGRLLLPFQETAEKIVRALNYQGE